MTAERALRVSQSIKKELAEMIQRDLRDERLTGLISITEVECTSDLRSTKIHISVFAPAKTEVPAGKAEDQAEQKPQVSAAAAADLAAEKVVECLNEQAGFIRGEICRRLGLRFAPEMVFKLDTSLERGSKVTDLLGKISRGEV
ncbi:MAG: ribosome-binding factor A [Candidatus Melainabacteria bacterium]|nr:ribosome-binding factor A [Candidatus Melainabacteria bacterium]